MGAMGEDGSKRGRLRTKMSSFVSMMSKFGSAMKCRVPIVIRGPFVLN
jgi:hypothetical protein